MKVLVYLILLTYCITGGKADTGHHSLWLFTTHILGESDLPELSAVVVLDDLKVAHYDPIDKRIVYKKDGHQEEKMDPGTRHSIGIVFEDTFKNMKERSSLMRDRFNTTEVLVQQRVTECELLNNDEGQIMIKDVFSGVNGMLLISNMQQYHYQTGWSELVFKQKREHHTRRLFKDLYLPICIQTLKDLLRKEKSSKEPLKIRFFQKETQRKSGGVRVNCLASGFYPSHINLTLLRDGQPVAEQELIVGELLPNGDGTYQLQKGLDISAGDGHRYTCTAAHLSLDNKLITWENVSGLEPVSILGPALMASLVMLVLSVLAIAVVYAVRRMNIGRCHYSAGATAETEPAASLDSVPVSSSL